MIEEAISWVYIKGRVCIWGRQNQSETFFYAEAVCSERDVVREQVEYPKSIQWSKQQGCWDKKTGTQTGTRLVQLAKSFSHQIFFVASAITRPEWSFSSFCHTLTAYACTEESIYSGFKNDTCFLTFRLTQKSKLNWDGRATFLLLCYRTKDLEFGPSVVAGCLTFLAVRCCLVLLIAFYS